MTRDELIKALQSMPHNLEVAVTTDPNRETYTACLVGIETDDVGAFILITGHEFTEAAFGPEVRE